MATYRDLGVTVMRYSGFSGEYSPHGFGLLRDYTGVELPVVVSCVGQSVHRDGTVNPNSFSTTRILTTARRSHTPTP